MYPFAYRPSERGYLIESENCTFSMLSDSFFSFSEGEWGGYQSNVSNVHSFTCFKIKLCIDSLANLNFLKHTLSALLRQNLLISLNLY